MRTAAANWMRTMILYYQIFNKQANGPVGQTGASAQCHAVAERRREVVTVCKYPETIIHVSDLQRKSTDVLDTNAQVSVAHSIGSKILHYCVLVNWKITN